jgi:hypothetical protein
MERIQSLLLCILPSYYYCIYIIFLMHPRGATYYFRRICGSHTHMERIQSLLLYILPSYIYIIFLMHSRGAIWLLKRGSAYVPVEMRLVLQWPWEAYHQNHNSTGFPMVILLNRFYDASWVLGVVEVRRLRCPQAPGAKILVFCQPHKCTGKSHLHSCKIHEIRCITICNVQQ